MIDTNVLTGRTLLKMEGIMKAYQELKKEELAIIKTELDKKYQDIKAKGMVLDISRGKPASEQLDIGMDFLDSVSSKDVTKTEAGFDCRNYGLLDGIPEAKELMAEIMNVPSDSVIVCGNASLNIMYDSISRAMVHGILGNTPWAKLDKVKFLCPVPGYDRHFAITEHFGIEMINVPMNDNGPDMDMVEELVESDDSIKGIWCVPKYSNPQGVTYSDEVVDRFANLKPAAKDFRIFWDNAYAIHYLYEDKIDDLKDILTACKEAGNEDMVYEFASTSKVIFAGGGISAVAMSKANKEEYMKSMTIQTIGYDKLNQLRHVKYFKDINGVMAHMKKHAEILRPKFETVLNVLETEIGELNIGTWLNPNGGYFVSFDAMEGCAKRVVTLCKEAGLVLTGAGATYPYKKDPKDSNIRIAPTFTSTKELDMAMELFVLCVKLASIEKLLA